MKEKSLKHLSFDSLLAGLRSAVRKAEDHRHPAKIQYSLEDVVVSGFACMFFQEPSLLQFQQRMKEEQQRSNLETVFGVRDIPKDSQLRELLDSFNPGHLNRVFRDYFLRLQRGKHLEQYRVLEKYYLVPMDGTQFFCSEEIHCEHCLETTTEQGEVVRYAHKALQLALVHPDIKQVIPLMAEEIRNTDGRTKQDCETNAAKRALQRLRQDHPQLNILLSGDGLFSKQPMIELALEKRMHFIFVAKPDDHKALFEYVNRSSELSELRFQHAEYTWVCRWLNDVPLKGSEEALSVNYLSLSLLKKDQHAQEKETYRNSWVTDLPVFESNIFELAKAGRARWRIENECFNTLKNQGYSLEHNYGHGKQHLCFNFYQLILLAFTFHQIFELTDGLFQASREKAGSKRYLWECLRSTVGHIVVDSWQMLLGVYLGLVKYRVVFSSA